MSTPGGTVVTILVAGAFAWFLVRHTLSDILWRFQQRARRMMRAEDEAGRYLAAQQPPEPTEPWPILAGWDANDHAAFERAMQEWGPDLIPMFAFLRDIEYVPSDWESVG